MQRRIAIVEDDDVIRGNYRDFLAGLGFSVDGYSTREEARVGLVRHMPDIVLLDISLHGERDAGFAVCAEVRRQSSTVPIIFLTSHDAEVERISAFRLGADDYITKDVSLDYLVVRIEALFRRLDAYASALSGAAARTPSVVSAGEGIVVFDSRTSRASWRGRPLELTLTQTWMLQDLCASPGVVRTHSDLMQAGRIVVEGNTVVAHVKAIRDGFLRIDPAFDRIRTERGRGYRWMPAS